MSIFKLQYFSVKQTISGMKICSDSLLFGAMIPVANAVNILDVGAGTGILSLMLAQQSNQLNHKTLKKITAVELTEEGAFESTENFNSSPWSQQLVVVQQDIQSFARQYSASTSERYDLIVCNPPFFSDHSKTDSQNLLRQQARHTDTLSFTDLFHSIDLLLTAVGSAYFLLPVISIEEFCDSASRKGMVAVERIDIAESAEHVVKVTVMKFVRECSLTDISHTAKLNIVRVNKFILPNIHSEEAKTLLSPFLLRYR